MKKTIGVVLGTRSDSSFKNAVRELRAMGFSFNGASKEWSKKLDEEYVTSCLKQLKAAGLKAYIKEEAGQ